MEVCLAGWGTVFTATEERLTSKSELAGTKEMSGRLGALALCPEDLSSDTSTPQRGDHSHL